MDGTIKAMLSNVVRRDEATKEEGEGERASERADHLHFFVCVVWRARGSDTHDGRRFNCLPGVQRHSHQTSWADDGGEEPFVVMSARSLNIKCLARNEGTSTQASDNAFMRKAGWCVNQVQIQASQA